MKPFGIILIIIGVVLLVYQGFTYTQTKEVAKLGPVDIQSHETHHVWVPPVIGGVCIAGGVVALILGARKA